ncbi:MAG: FAD-binding protein [Candidatus Binatia bacterium]
MKQVARVLRGWGRYPAVPASEIEGRDLAAITRDAVLTRGLGRSYGDASLPPAGRGPVASSLQADRVLSFDEGAGLLQAEAGLSLGALAQLFLPRAFFVPVTPGTRDVTLGGMVAADVHGKNHHVAGTIGAHVRALTMRLPDGRLEEVTRSSNEELFRATLGGMGLTGHILDVTLALESVPSRHIVEETTTFPDLESLVDGLLEAGRCWPMTVAWSDLLADRGSFGRGILACGRWADADEACRASSFEAPRVPVPFEMPVRLLGNRTIGAFNALRYEAARRSASGPITKVRSAESFFYPLDALGNWNLLYGRRGFTQYQCVLPPDATMRSYRRLAGIARSGGPGPFLTVIKDCGAEGEGLLSFPMPGVSFALDFPVHDGTPELVARLNDFVAAAGGRIYLAKDAFTTAEQFAAMEPRLPAFLEVRKRLDPDGRIESALSRRLFPPSA